MSGMFSLKSSIWDLTWEAICLAVWDSRFFSSLYMPRHRLPTWKQDGWKQKKHIRFQGWYYKQVILWETKSFSSFFAVLYTLRKSTKLLPSASNETTFRYKSRGPCTTESTHFLVYQHNYHRKIIGRKSKFILWYQSKRATEKTETGKTRPLYNFDQKSVGCALIISSKNKFFFPTITLKKGTYQISKKIVNPKIQKKNSKKVLNPIFVSCLTTNNARNYVCI